jgi:elongation factor Ts
VVLAKVNADQTAGVVVSVNCETDFVAKNDSYLKLANDLVDQALEYDSMDDFLGSAFDGMTVAEKLTEQTGVIGEKIEIGSFKTLKASFVGSYIHAGNKIATLVGLSGAIDNGAEVAKNVAMQVAAMNPIALNEEQVDASVVEKEIEIAKDQLRQEGKPEAMLDNIVKGKIKRFYKDNTLVNQDFIKDSKISVAAYVKSAGDALVTGFERVALV